MRTHELMNNLFRERHQSGLDIQIVPLGLHLPEQCLLSPLEPTIGHLLLLLMTIIKQPLYTLHVVLKLAITEVVDVRHSEWQIVLHDEILKHFEVPSKICFVLGQKVEALEMSSV